MRKKLFHNVYYFLIPFLIVGLSFGYTTFSVAFLALLPLLVLSNRHTVGIFLLMYGGEMGGVIRSVYPILPIYGLLLQIIGIILIRDLVVDLFCRNARWVWGMFLLLSVFGFFYYIGPKDSFSTDKYIGMCQHGIFMLFGYYAIDRADRVDAESLARMLMLTAVCMFAFVIQTVGMKRGGLLDYNWFREQLFQYDNYGSDEHSLVGYQAIGMSGLFAMAIYVSQLQLKRLETLFYLIFGSQLILTSGTRQALLGLALVLALRFVVFREENINHISFSRVFKIILGLFMAVVVALFVFHNLSSDVVSKTLDEGDQGRMIHYLGAIAIFLDNPILGCGIGGFHAIRDESWPHNFFLELLCETGILGTVVFLLFFLVTFIRKKQSLFHLTTSKWFYFLLLMAIVVRVMVSADFRVSIELFSAVFAISTSNSLKTNYRSIE